MAEEKQIKKSEEEQAPVKAEVKETAAKKLENVEEKSDQKPIEAETPMGEKEVVVEAKDSEAPVAEVPEEKAKEVNPVSEKDNRKGFRRGRRFLTDEEKREEIISGWIPKTKLGKLVKAKKITDINEILDENKKILEPEIVDTLIPVKTDLIAMGQSKGKFGGGKRRAWRQTQRKTKEGNVPTFSAFAVCGDSNGHVGIGVGKSSETLPARDKATRKAKLNIIKIIRGDGSFDSVGEGNASIPFKIQGKCGSVRVTLMPAAPGTGLVVADELKKVLRLAGIEDVYSKTSGRVRTTFNLIKACMDALEKTNPKLAENKK